MLDKAKAFVKEHKEEIIATALGGAFGVVCLLTAYNAGKNSADHRIKGANQGVVDGVEVLVVDFYDGTSQILREPLK